MKTALKWTAGIIIIILAGYFILTEEVKREQSESEPIVIGFIAPLTGDASFYGGPKRNTVALAVDEINEKGGVGGRMLKVIYEDGRCTGRGGADAAQKLVHEDKVKVIIGGFCSSESVSAEPITTSGDVFLISAGSSSPDLTDVSPLFARTYPSDASQGTVLANIAHERGWRTVAFMLERLDYPLGIYTAFKNRFEELGGVVVSEEFSPTATSLYAPLVRLQLEKPDALFIDTQTAASAERVLMEFKTMDWDLPLLLSDAPASDPTFISENAEVLEGTLVAIFGVNDQSAVFKHLNTRYEALYGPMPYASYMQAVYDTVYLLANGIEEVGYDAEALAEWVREVEDWEGASGIVDIGENGDRLGGHQPKKIENGELRYLE